MHVWLAANLWNSTLSSYSWKLHLNVLKQWHTLSRLMTDDSTQKEWIARVSVCALFWLTPAVLTCVLLSFAFLFILFLSTILTWGTEKQKPIIQALKGCTRKLYSRKFFLTAQSCLHSSSLNSSGTFPHPIMPHVPNQNVKDRLYMPLTYSINSIIVAHAFLLGFVIFSEDIRLISSHRQFHGDNNNW